MRRFVTAAAVPTTGALVATVVLVAVAAQTPLLVPMLSILLALTVPHVVFVAMLDGVSGYWGTNSAAAGPAGGTGRPYELPAQRRPASADV